MTSFEYGDVYTPPVIEMKSLVNIGDAFEVQDRAMVKQRAAVFAENVRDT